MSFCSTWFTIKCTGFVSYYQIQEAILTYDQDKTLPCNAKTENLAKLMIMYCN